MELVSPDATQVLGTIESGSPVTVSWEMHCIEASLGDYIEVYADGFDANSGAYISDLDTIFVDQVNPAELDVEIIEPLDGCEFAVCQNFWVTALVSNVGIDPEADAVDVTATITYGPNMELVSPGATQVLGTIESGFPVMVSWEMHCLAPSLNDFITVTAEGYDANTGAYTSDSDTIHVDQLKAHLTVDIVAPETSTLINVLQQFYVDAMVTNTGNGPAAMVTATIAIDGPASLKPWEVSTKPTMPDLLMPSESGWVSWELHCDALGDVIISVTADGIDVASGQLLSVLGNITPDSVTVHQRYLVDLWGPEWDPTVNPDGWNQISLMVRPENTDISVVLDGVKDKVVSVWYYDASTEDWGGTWLSATYDPMTDTWVGDLLTMEDGKGYWIQVTESCIIALVGNPVAPPEPGPNLPPSYQVYKGWNLVGFSSIVPMPLDEYFFTVYYNDILKKVWWWGSGPWYQWWLPDDIIYDGDLVIMPSTARVLSDVELKPGQGYWIWVAEDSEIVVPWNEG
jgi:hypothetical protein